MNKKRIDLDDAGIRIMLETQLDDNQLKLVRELTHEFSDVSTDGKMYVEDNNLYMELYAGKRLLNRTNIGTLIKL